MKYKVKLSDWYLQRSDAKLPVKTDFSIKGNIILIGKNDEAITENIQGIENDPRFIIEKIEEIESETKEPEIKRGRKVRSVAPEETKIEE